MFTLWLARHGEAVDPDRASSDFARVLTETGRNRLTQTADWLKGREQAPDLFLHSPLVRARQTAEIIGAVFGADADSIRVENALAPGIDIDKLLKRLADTMTERVLCVCHQPDVSHCLSDVIGGGHVLYTPGTIAAVDFSNGIVRSGGHLRWVADPRWFA